MVQSTTVIHIIISNEVLPEKVARVAGDEPVILVSWSEWFMF